MRYGGLIIAVVFAAIAAVVVLKMSGDKTAPAPVAAAPTDTKSVTIYVAKAPIPIGTTLTRDMIATQQWPEHLALEGFMYTDQKDAAPVEGMVARGPFQQNEPLISSKLANPNDPNFLAGELPKGMRVVSIPIDEVNGVAGFVFPGDHVDVIYTHDVDKWEYPPATSSGDGSQTQSAPTKTKVTVTETLLTNVKVLAVDQRASGAGATDKNGNLVIPRSASLMVSQTDAQRVRLGQKTGTLSLVLRALADKESADPLVLTSGKDVSQSTTQGDTGPAGDEASVKVVRGAPVTDKENVSSSASVPQGAPVTAGGVLPSGIVNPGLVAVP